MIKRYFQRVGKSLQYSWKGYIRQVYKENWKSNFIDNNSVQDINVAAFMEKILGLTISGVIFSFLVSAALYVIYFRDQIITSTADHLVVLATLYHVGFIEAYTALCVVILAGVWMVISVWWSFVGIIYTSPVNNALAEIAYLLEHPTTPKKEEPEVAAEHPTSHSA